MFFIHRAKMWWRFFYTFSNKLKTGCAPSFLWNDLSFHPSSRCRFPSKKVINFRNGWNIVDFMLFCCIVIYSHFYISIKSDFVFFLCVSFSMLALCLLAWNKLFRIFNFSFFFVAWLLKQWMANKSNVK